MYNPVLAYPNFDLPFTLKTDSSKLAVIAIISEVPDGVQGLIAYASRHITKEEQAYLASEGEMLAIVWKKNIRNR